MKTLEGLIAILITMISFVANAQVIFQISIGGNSSERASALKITQQKDYLVAGITSGPFGLSDIYLAKVDSSGNYLWGKIFGGTGYDRVKGIDETSDRGYVLIGQSTSFIGPDGDIYVIKTDSNGNVLWSKTYGGIYYDYGEYIQQTSDGGLIMLGYTESFNAIDSPITIGDYDLYLLKLMQTVKFNGQEFMGESGILEIMMTTLTL